MRRCVVTGMGVALLMALLLAGCSARTPTAGETPDISGTPTTGVSSTPRQRFPRAVAAVYALDGALLYYDVKADKVHELTRGEGIRAPRWISADEISFVQDGDGRNSSLFRVNVRTAAIEKVFEIDTGIATYGWSPDASTVAYVTVDDHDFPQIHFRSLAGDAVRTVATLARQFGREFVDDDQLLVEYAPDGEHVLIVYTLANDGSEPLAREESPVQVRTDTGALVYAPEPANGPTMGAWASDGSRVFFRMNAGARSWTVSDSRVQFLVGKPRWYDPWPSPDGGAVAYDTGRSDPGSKIRVLDLRAGTITAVSAPGRIKPVFASTQTIWAQRIRACSGDCLVPGVPVNEVVAIDLKSGKERKLAITSLLDVDVRYA